MYWPLGKGGVTHLPSQLGHIYLPLREGIVAWAQTRQINGFLEAINGLFQASKRRARGFTRLSTIRTVIFLIAGKIDFHAINPHAGQPT